MDTIKSIRIVPKECGCFKGGIRMVEVIIGTLIVGYTGFVIYRKSKDVKEGKSCCSNCSSCPSKDKCK